MAANWGALTEHLTRGEDRVTLSWDELDRIVGGMPESSIRHTAWWSGNRPQTRAWKAAGYRVAVREPGVRVAFEKESAQPQLSEARPGTDATAADGIGEVGNRTVDLVLVSCVKEKGAVPAFARDLYVSTLFRTMRAYAESAECPWFILSAEHGLVTPEEWLAPYDRYLKETPGDYRRAWGEWVAARLERSQAPSRTRSSRSMRALLMSTHLLEPLQRRGARVDLPLTGLRPVSD
jgi:hypothetical protein